MAASSTPNSTSLMYLQNVDEVRKMFQRFDSNGDGKISTTELSGVLEALGSSISDEEVAKMMVEIDSDKDGHINLEEFAAFCKGEADPYNSAEKEVKEAFELYDQDHDGKISAAELHLILTRLGENCSVADCAGMINSFDSDGDGFVSFDEFKRMMAASNNAAA
ncbi:calcium-binding allergen Ole e 8-like [Primulina huaijiensis]|uniref:calcium-binding allergen Ole e 8-like n=1 Tax=Primulina huaijiensis TaxID=1492673 RepID=UPI003CC71CBF